MSEDSRALSRFLESFQSMPYGFEGREGAFGASGGDHRLARDAQPARKNAMAVR